MRSDVAAPPGGEVDELRGWQLAAGPAAHGQLPGLTGERGRPEAYAITKRAKGIDG